MFWHYSKAKRAGDLPKRIVSDPYDILHLKERRITPTANLPPNIYRSPSPGALFFITKRTESKNSPYPSGRETRADRLFAFLDQLRRSISARVFTPENSVEQACEY